MHRLSSIVRGTQVSTRLVIALCVVLVFAVAASVALGADPNKPITPTIPATNRAEHITHPSDFESFVGDTDQTCANGGCHSFTCDSCHFVGPAPDLTTAQAAAPAPTGHVTMACSACHTILPDVTNTPPVLNAVGNKSVDELTLLSFTATATDPEAPPQTLTFSLGAGAPAGAAITAGGVFTWTPTEAQGPGSYPITITVSDGAATDSETITVTVNEVAAANTPPVLNAVGNKSVDELTLLSFTATATDPEAPPQTLTFSLGAGAPAGAAITAGGVFTWTPTEAQGPGSYPITITVSDGTATDSETITVTVNEVPAPPGPVDNLALVDYGFESGADGSPLAPAVWTVTGTPQHAEYDTAQAKIGTTSGWIQGPAGAATGGASESQSASMSADGNEVRFWLYFDTATQARYATGVTNSTTASTFWLRFNSDGVLGAYTNKAGVTGYAQNTYEPVGTYATGWTQYRVVYDFTNQGYTLSQRANESDAWTPLKSAGASNYTIPFRGTSTITSSDGTWFRAPLSANMWVDEVQHTDHTAPEITVSGVTDGQSSPGPVTISFSAIDDVDPAPATTATLNGGAFTSGTEVSTPGAYALVVTSTDATGNTATKTVIFTIEAAPDTTPPVITINGVTDGGSYTNPRTVTFSATDDFDGPVAATATLNGDPFTSGTEVSALGSYTLVVTASDSVPNTATKTISFTIGATEPPVVSTPASSTWSLGLLALLGAIGVGLIRKRATA